MAKTAAKIKPKVRKHPKVYTKTQNVVVSASLHRDLPLERLAAKLERADYNPETFPGLILKLDVPKASALLFSSGKIICTGTKSLREARTAIEAIVKKLGAIGIKVKGDTEIEVQNMVASGDVGGKLNLNEIIFKFENTEYDPEQFPGLVYKLPNSHITFLLFGTGKIVITGAKSEKEIVESVWTLRDQLIAAGELQE
ncbi:MAG TPA: TATA-box-binding protein [Candidatus Nanoarchaeia archaeon]|nr:TATA-box-binding protein [Candidatus Nanoarchaeia archaeon]